MTRRPRRLRPTLDADLRVETLVAKHEGALKDLARELFADLVEMHCAEPDAPTAVELLVLRVVVGDLLEMERAVEDGLLRAEEAARLEHPGDRARRRLAAGVETSRARSVFALRARTALGLLTDLRTEDLQCVPPQESANVIPLARR